jgi:hypothetical protein
MWPMASQPWERMQDNGHSEPRRGDIGHHFDLMSPLRGWRSILGGAFTHGWLAMGQMMLLASRAFIGAEF